MNEWINLSQRCLPMANTVNPKLQELESWNSERMFIPNYVSCFYLHYLYRPALSGHYAVCFKVVLLRLVPEVKVSQVLPLRDVLLTSGQKWIHSARASQHLPPYNLSYQIKFIFSISRNSLYSFWNKFCCFTWGSYSSAQSN